ncbi:MAG: hypothetical protein ACK4M7_05395, partial [Burkholderiales bacterium]
MKTSSAIFNSKLPTFPGVFPSQSNKGLGVGRLESKSAANRLALIKFIERNIEKIGNQVFLSKNHDGTYQLKVPLWKIKELCKMADPTQTKKTIFESFLNQNVEIKDGFMYSNITKDKINELSEQISVSDKRTSLIKIPSQREEIFNDSSWEITDTTLTEFYSLTKSGSLADRLRLVVRNNKRYLDPILKVASAFTFALTNVYGFATISALVSINQSEPIYNEENQISLTPLILKEKKAELIKFTQEYTEQIIGSVSLSQTSDGNYQLKTPFENIKSKLNQQGQSFEERFERWAYKGLVKGDLKFKDGFIYQNITPNYLNNLIKSFAEAKISTTTSRTPLIRTETVKDMIWDWQITEASLAEFYSLTQSESLTDKLRLAVRTHQNYIDPIL